VIRAGGTGPSGDLAGDRSHRPRRGAEACPCRATRAAGRPAAGRAAAKARSCRSAARRGREKEPLAAMKDQPSSPPADGCRQTPKPPRRRPGRSPGAVTHTMIQTA